MAHLNCGCWECCKKDRQSTDYSSNATVWPVSKSLYHQGYQAGVAAEKVYWKEKMAEALKALNEVQAELISKRGTTKERPRAARTRPGLERKINEY